MDKQVKIIIGVCGFFIIALIVALVIILPKITLDSVEDSADDYKRISGLRSLELGLVQHKSVYGGYPEAGSTLNKCVILSESEAGSLVLIVEKSPLDRLDSAKNNADDSKDIAQLRSLELDLLQYNSAQGGYPEAGSTLNKCVILSESETGSLVLIVEKSPLDRLDSAKNNADDSKDIAQLRSLELGLLQYNSVQGGYPEAGSTLNKCVTLSEGGTGSIENALRSALPTFDWNNDNYFYCSDVKQTILGTNNSRATKYVLGVKNIDKANRVLGIDKDGRAPVAGITLDGHAGVEGCGNSTNDTVYCLTGGR